MIEITIPIEDLGLRVQRKKHGDKQAVEVLVINLSDIGVAIAMIDDTLTKLRKLEQIYSG